MNEYGLHIGYRTRFLNIFRRVFMLPVLENFLIRQIDRSSRTMWRKLIPPDYLYKKQSIRKTCINGISYVLDIHNVVEHLVYFRVAPEKFHLVEKAIQHARVILDIGANIGSTALYFASKNPQAEIYAFEPHPETYQKARRNIEMNPSTSIHLVHKGLGETATTEKLYQVADNNPGMNRIMPENTTFPFVSIQVDTMDAFCTARGISDVDFVKIDVEGFEYHVLKGGKNILSRNHPLIYLELYDHGLTKNGHSASELIVLLIEMGYNRFTNAYTLEPVGESSNLSGCDFDLIVEKI